jgi:hypothetical protein
MSSGLEVLYSAPISNLLNTSITAIINPNTGAFSSVYPNVVPFFATAASPPHQSYFDPPLSFSFSMTFV